MKSAIAFCLTLLVLSAANFVSQTIGGEFEDGPMLAGLMIVGTALMVGLVAAVPVFGVWVPLDAFLRNMGVAPRLAAVLAAGPAASIGAVATGYVSRELTGGFGTATQMPGTFEVAIVVIVGMLVTFVTWIIMTKKDEPA